MNRAVFIFILGLCAVGLTGACGAFWEAFIREEIVEDAYRASGERHATWMAISKKQEEIRKVRAWSVACDSRGNYAIYSGSGSLIELPASMNSEAGALRAIAVLQGHERNRGKDNADWEQREREL